ncbi:MAG: hypothetical protein WCR61_05705, partial [Bacteroidales bacterium]
MSKFNRFLLNLPCGLNYWEYYRMPGVGSYHLVFPLAFILLLLRFFLRKKITIPAPGSDQQSD